LLLIKCKKKHIWQQIHYKFTEIILINQNILNGLAEILEMQPGSISEDTLLETLDTWDSLATISFIALVDELTGHVLEGDALQKAKSIGDLLLLAKAVP
jgi:acyl carrier protein